MSEIMLVQARNVAKSYGRQSALLGCSLDIQRGEVFGLLGPNGAGKTTMARIIAGFLTATSGSVAVDGMEPWRFRNERGIGFMPEQLQRAGHWTLEHLIGLRDRGTGAGGAMRDLIEIFGLTRIARREIRTYSTGQLRMTAAAYALAGAPPLVILDEPDSGLDMLAAEKLTDAIREAKSAVSTVIVLGHNLYHIAEICDRAAFFFDGALRGVAHVTTADELRAQYRTASLPNPMVPA